jgi:protein-L-isoaspartate(D-aspartate) O-methyltransferase
MHPAVARAHQQLMDFLVAQGALWSAPLREAFRSTPRHRFLDRVYHYSQRLGRWREIPTRPPTRAALRLVYSDRALTTRLSDGAPGRPAVPISSSSQPSLMAQMLEDLRLGPGLRVLEVGAGTGYNAALLGRVVGRVVSLDVDRRVVAEAEEHLRAFPERRVEFHAGDGRAGHAVAAPYDRVMVTAATPDLEPAWLGQAEEGGLVQAPLALAPGLAFLVQGEVWGGAFEGRLTRQAYFIPLRPGAGEEDTPGPAEVAAAAALVPDPAALSPAAPPWTGWGSEKGTGPPAYVRALAFLAWLEGLTLAYRSFGEEGAVFGVADLVHGHACWLGRREWRVTGPAGRELGERLWRTFLEAGGPLPCEFRLRARADGREPGPAAGGTLTYRRQGPRTSQLWELTEPRERPAAP